MVKHKEQQLYPCFVIKAGQKSDEADEIPPHPYH